MGYERLTAPPTCPSCPTVFWATLFEGLGWKDKAEEVRQAGCEWLWYVELEDESGNPVAPAFVCGRSHLRRAINKLGGEVKLASGTIQQDRNEQKKALETVVQASRESGAAPVLAQLIEIGMRAYLGSQIAAHTQALLDGDGSADKNPEAVDIEKDLTLSGDPNVRSAHGFLGDESCIIASGGSSKPDEEDLLASGGVSENRQLHVAAGTHEDILVSGRHYPGDDEPSRGVGCRGGGEDDQQ